MTEACHRPLLVLEDSDDDFDTLEEARRAAGLRNEVRRAITGEACLELLRDGSVWPAVVLLDLNTPGLDGRATLQEIKQDPALRSLPVVVFTTSSNPRDLAFCYGAGANAYHVKPVRYPEHLQVVRALLGYWLGPVTLPGRERPVT
jgi:CheY-like chemotaxis protein